MNTSDRISHLRGQAEAHEASAERDLRFAAFLYGQRCFDKARAVQARAEAADERAYCLRMEAAELAAAQGLREQLCGFVLSEGCAR